MATNFFYPLNPTLHLHLYYFFSFLFFFSSSSDGVEKPGWAFQRAGAFKACMIGNRDFQRYSPHVQYVKISQFLASFEAYLGN